MKYILTLSTYLIFALHINAQKVVVAAAANLRYVLEEIKEQYIKENPSVVINITYGASGTLTQQILNGAPFDVFMSADTFFPNKIEAEGFALGKAKTYCFGRIVMYAPTLDISEGINTILSSKIKKIAIANPTTAPYGKNIVETLKKLKLYDKIVNKVVWGENVSQTAQFIFSGNAEIGFIALSLVLSPQIKNKNYYLLPVDICEPIEQQAILIKRKNKNNEGEKFMNYLYDKKLNDIWEKYGYGLVN